MSGALLFARYAHPPNELGYCGSEDHEALLAARRVADPARILAFARGFEAAWPYLQLLSALAGVDPLDARVQEAYWTGNDLLDEVDPAAFSRWLEDRPALRSAAPWEEVRRQALAGARPTHAFHVFALYPWFGLLRAGHEGRPLEVLDRCRIRWGTVLGLDGDRARVRTRLLAWDGRRLSLGPEREEDVAILPEEGPDALVFGEGDVVSLHWDQVCDRLTSWQAGELERRTLQHLDLANGAG